MTILSLEELSRLTSLIDTLSVNQLIWISGYVHGLVNSKVMVNEITRNTCIVEPQQNKSLTQQVVLISASQTGNARHIAKQLYENFVDAGIDIISFNAGEYKFKKIAAVKLLIFITSTHGDGEPPEEAVALYRYLFSKKAEKMQFTNFVVLGLGDRAYQNFAKAGKDFDRRFEELGANRLYERVDVDVDFQNVVDIWIKKIVSVFKAHISQMHSYSVSSSLNHMHSQKIDASCKIVTYSKESPLITYLISNQKITSRSSLKDVHHLEFDISGSNACYQPGDSLGVWYENDHNLIDELLNLFNLTGHELVNIKNQSISLYEALKQHYELTQNTAVVINNVANISHNPELLHLLQEPKQLNIFISTTPIIDMFHKISVKLTPQELLQVLRPLNPRFYSISSAQSEVGEEIHITVNVVRYKINERWRSGGASSYLVDRLQENDKVRVFIESNNNFRLPQNSAVPIIMISAGTGVAPFRAFMQQRASEEIIGKNWLFFGNLKFIDDFLYQTEWQSYVKDGILYRIDTAWSRDQEHKVYVQDKLLQNSVEVWKWIQEGAHIYVCGDAKSMARDVEQSLILLVSRHGNMNISESNDFWNDMRSSNRYQRDIY